MDLLSRSTDLRSYRSKQKKMTLKELLNITVVPGGAAESWGGGQGGHQADADQDVGQLPDDRVVWARLGSWQAWPCSPPPAVQDLHWGLAAGWTDSLVVAAVKLVEVLQEGERVGLLQVGLWANTLEHWRG